MTTTQRWDPKLYDGKHAYVADLARSLVDDLELTGSETVVDLGCGTGRSTEWLRELGVTPIGIDRDPEMVAAARERLPDVEFRVADARALGDLECDAMLSNATLHWVLEPGRAAAEMGRVMRSGGRLAVELGGRGNMSAVVRAFRQALARQGRDFDPAQRWYFPSVGRHASLLESCGFRVDSARLFPRWTKLEGEDGLRNWVRMFLGSELDGLDDAAREQVLSDVESGSRDQLWCDGSWYADYVRLRVRATRV